MVARADEAEATRLRILDAARQLFAELLYDQVSLNTVAGLAGVTVLVIAHGTAPPELGKLLPAVGAVVAGMNVNVWDVTDDIQALIRSGTTVDQARLTDPDVPLTEL